MTAIRDISTEPDGIVYDLDGTVVRLRVDWEQVAADVLEVYETADIDPSTSDLWELIDSASGHGIQPAVEEAIASHERVGAREAVQLPVAQRLREDDRPTAVCSLNCEAACRIALETHGLDTAVSAIIGRDSVAGRKPAPEPLVAAFDAIDISPERGLFIGDSESDKTAAERANVPFRFVSELPE